MRGFLLIVLAVIILGGSCKHKTDASGKDFVLVKGGESVNTKSNLYGKISLSDFYIGIHEVTQKEWIEIMGSNPSKFKGDSLPVESVSWYECVEYCNKKIIKEGLEPYYIFNKEQKDPINTSEFDSLKFTVTVNTGANGFRLPSEAEWEYAASGGQKSKNFKYSGSDNINELAWYWRTSGDQILTGSWLWPEVEKNHCRTHPVALKKPNELGIFDMSGNVREWCEDWYQDNEIQSGKVRSQRGGGWMGAEHRCEISNRHSFEASGKGPDQGFRICKGI